jgi:hypothetical protein
MRFRVGLILCLLAIFAAVGCRKALAPNVDRNKAPETWITAAPFDTITLIKGDPPQVGTIPIRFHVYWAGSDRDGAVVGYYWAVVETLPLPQEGAIRPPPLPGPRPGDYHYTTRTDSIFIFDVAEDVPDRLHAFFIYAVDDQGKPDPTPARFIFNALDRFPPVPVIDEARAVGTVYRFNGPLLEPETRTYDIRDSLNFTTQPSDTVPSGSRIRFRFHGEVTVAGGIVAGFRYKLDDSELQPTDPDSLFHGSIIEYHVPAAERDPARHGADTVLVATGTKVFTLRAVDQARGSRDVTRRFQLNFSPDTWFAGPDPDVTGGPWQVKPNGDKYALLIDGQVPPGGLPGTLLGPDSVRILPAARVPHRTFLEVYKDTIFLRHEFDTVHMGSWVIIHNGGFDRDSPYRVRVADGIKDLLPSFPDGPVLQPAAQNGSPIGFRSRITNFLTPNGPLSFTSQSGLYPTFDPNDVQNFPRIAAYHPMFLSGTAYSLQRAEDGDQARDGRVDDAYNLVNHPVDDNERSLRPLVLVFFVNFPPELNTADLSFRPSVAAVDTFYSRSWDLRLPADDIDPYASGDPYGGPSAGKTLRIRLKVTGKDTTGADFSFTDPPAGAPLQKYINVSDINLLVPPDLASGAAVLTVELCDCSFCELNPGEGRCITRNIPVYYVRPPSGTAVRASRPGLD